MKGVYGFIICCALFLTISGAASAEVYDSYILKYEGEDNVHVITAKEKAELFADTHADANTFLSNGKNIEYIEPNYEVSLYDDGEKNWNASMIGADTCWEYGCYGNGIKIAVLDSGANNCDGLKHSIASGYNLINYSSDVSDNIGHGTFVCGIISSSADNEHSDGISKKAVIIPIKCFDRNYTTRVDKIAEALEYVINNVDCKIINMSFGINGNSAYLKSKIDSALQKGIIVVAAVGNNGTDSLRYPAAYDGVIGVGAIDDQYSWCDFSQHNKSVDIVAPGRNIDGVGIDGYTKISGTSFATPHIAAAAALALSIDGELTSEQFIELLQMTSIDLGDEGYDEYYGYGLIDMEKITEQLMNQYNVFMSPINIDDSKYTAVVKNNTDGELNVINIIYTHVDTGYKIIPLRLNAHEKIVVTADVESTEIIKSLLWKDFNTMKPLISSRQYVK